VRPEFADYIASSVKQRWLFLVSPGEERGLQRIRAHFTIGNEEDPEVDIDGFDGVGPGEVPGDEDDEVEHEDGQQDREPAAGDAEEEEGETADESSSDDE
jgi:hypothetical protein